MSLVSYMNRIAMRFYLYLEVLNKYSLHSGVGDNRQIQIVVLESRLDLENCAVFPLCKSIC